MKIKIEDRSIGDGEPCFIIAEAGSNHDGDIEQARRLIGAAAEAGADAVKFQLFKADKIAAKSKDVMVTEEKFTRRPVTLNEFYKSLEFQLEWLAPLKEEAERQGLIFMMTPFDEESADRLEDFGITSFKVASFELTHLPLLRHLAGKRLPVLLSTGMASMEEIAEAVDVFEAEGNRHIALLHCGIDYPLDFEDVHLRSMSSMMKRWDYPVGYSDHTLGWSVPVAAVALGAKVYEKHFTVDKALAGPDHRFALEPQELKSMVRAMREAEASLGSARKRVRDFEMTHYRRGRRSLYAARPVRKGEVLTRDMIEVLRPGTGLAPRHLEQIVGCRAAVDLEEHQALSWDSVEA
ncbi:MAG TPA: N-acetylneuraminate synthase family protein [Acidobacteriota bacterium]|nr:N-acetylneuraminate synthase family protein [Acidobacteriota bacterium]